MRSSLRGGDAVRVEIHPDAQLRPDGIGLGDEAVVIAAELTGVVLREPDEAIRRAAPFENHRCADAEQFRAIIDEAIAGAIQREETLVAAAAYPLHVIAHAVGIHVEVHADAGFTEVDAVVGEVDDDGAAATPGIASS